MHVFGRWLRERAEPPVVAQRDEKRVAVDCGQPADQPEGAAVHRLLGQLRGACSLAEMRCDARSPQGGHAIIPRSFLLECDACIRRTRFAEAAEMRQHERPASLLIERVQPRRVGKGIVPDCRLRERQGSPSTNGMMNQGSPSVSPAASTGTMCGCCNRAASMISRLNRSMLTLAAISGGSTFTTTCRASAVSVATNTLDMPPPPSSRSMV